jgi:beta-lactamase superfamily II metal-dependent hydrolase
VDEIMMRRMSLVRVPQLQVHYIAVGQGDCILLKQGETFVLIDGGNRSSRIIQYLQTRIDYNLEAMIATHTHNDHVGGLIAMLDLFKVKRIYINGDTSSIRTYSDFMQKANTEGANVEVARRGDHIVVGNLTFDVLNPVEPLTQDTNNNSIVLTLSYGKVDFLFTGDAGREAETSMISAGVLQHSDILKVAHHGSQTASSQTFLDIVRPEVAIYMADGNNQYGHPHPQTMSALQTIGAKVYGTDACGTITVTTDGEGYTINQTGTGTQSL